MTDNKQHAESPRDLAAEFRAYADSPITGSPFVPIHRATLREAADKIERLRGIEAAAQALSAYDWTDPEERDDLLIALHRAVKPPPPAVLDLADGFPVVRPCLFRDGALWCAVGAGFLDVRQSPCGFGETQAEAMRAFRRIQAWPDDGLLDFWVCDDNPRRSGEGSW